MSLVLVVRVGHRPYLEPSIYHLSEPVDTDRRRRLVGSGDWRDHKAARPPGCRPPNGPLEEMQHVVLVRFGRVLSRAAQVHRFAVLFCVAAAPIWREFRSS